MMDDAQMPEGGDAMPEAPAAETPAAEGGDAMPEAPAAETPAAPAEGGDAPAAM